MMERCFRIEKSIRLVVGGGKKKKTPMMSIFSIFTVHTWKGPPIPGHNEHNEIMGVNGGSVFHYDFFSNSSRLMTILVENQ